MSTSRRGPAAWRPLVLIVGLIFLGVQIIDHSTSGRNSDPSLVYASVVVVALGLGVNLDWLRGGGDGRP